MHEPIVITGIGAIAAIGDDREAVWQGLKTGKSGVRRLRGIRGIPDDELVGAAVDLPPQIGGQLKAIALAERAAAEALDDARISWRTIDRDRFACAASAIVTDWAENRKIVRDEPSEVVGLRFLPNAPVIYLGEKFGLYGPRLAHSTACASGLIGVLAAVRAIQDDQCDIALAGAGDAIDGLMAAGFRQMGVLAQHDDPTQACRPFDAQRSGFVLGEGAAMFVIERLSHAYARRAKIYAEIRAGRMLAAAHHVTGLNAESDSLTHLIDITLQSAGLDAADIGHLNAHATGTAQNDLLEMKAIQHRFAKNDELCVTANKSSFGHLVNAAGSIELAMTVLAMRDGFAPPTLNLTDPDPECTFDATPLVGRTNRFQHALKLSVAFGGHLVAMALSRWNDAATGFGYPEERRAAA